VQLSGDDVPKVKHSKLPYALTGVVIFFQTSMLFLHLQLLVKVTVELYITNIRSQWVKKRYHFKGLLVGQ